MQSSSFNSTFFRTRTSIVLSFTKLKTICLFKNSLFLLLLIISISSFSQDAPVSQFYSNLVVLNPGFTGTTESDRVNLFYRNQWLRTDAGFNSFGFSYDKSFSKYNSGLGIVFTNEINGLYIAPTIDLVYSYMVEISPQFFVSMGLQGGIAQKYLLSSNLIFDDNSESITGGFSKIIPDFSSGIVTFYKNIYSGFSVDHIAQPFQGVSKSSNAKINRKYTGFAGYLYYFQTRLLSQERVLSPNLLVQIQGQQHNINWGVSFQYDNIIGGLWIRHNLHPDFDAVIFSAGIKTKSYRFTYSYDMNIGKTTTIPLGAHEISFTTIFETVKKKKYKMIKSPTFLQ